MNNALKKLLEALATLGMACVMSKTNADCAYYQGKCLRCGGAEPK
ncbi:MULTISPECIES: hypothetical protein [unclassified Streptomyces]|nr:hypothetical protein [Streptomyces sp. NBC_01775]WSB82081.1 hypothetical protein OHB04_40925 [Streptomyces sp. NBC_01775]WSS46814.1 hypothetical protein OG220_40330 [Streptomyces sp. NBC_01187]WSS46969.1 hypothetical protein OG220_41295 [Streptomyces sp. NBC_01187]